MCESGTLQAPVDLFFDQELHPLTGRASKQEVTLQTSRCITGRISKAEFTLPGYESDQIKSNILSILWILFSFASTNTVQLQPSPPGGAAPGLQSGCYSLILQNVVVWCRLISFFLGLKPNQVSEIRYESLLKSRRSK